MHNYFKYRKNGLFNMPKAMPSGHCLAKPIYQM
jgi:hypothetical protein